MRVGCLIDFFALLRSALLWPSTRLALRTGEGRAEGRGANNNLKENFNWRWRVPSCKIRGKAEAGWPISREEQINLSLLSLLSLLSST